MGLSKRQAQYRVKLPTIRGSVRKLRRGDVSMGDHTGKVVQILAYLRSKLSTINRPLEVSQTVALHFCKIFSPPRLLLRQSKLILYYQHSHTPLGLEEQTRINRIREENTQKDIWPRMCGGTMEEHIIATRCVSCMANFPHCSELHSVRLRWAGYKMRRVLDDPRPVKSS